MPELTIERLSLNLSGLSESDGRRLARLIADGLAAAQVTGVGEDREAMQSKITAPAGSSMQELSEQVVADLVRQLERSF